MNNRSLIDRLPIDVIIKLAAYLNDEKDKLALLRSHTHVPDKYPSLKLNSLSTNLSLERHITELIFPRPGCVPILSMGGFWVGAVLLLSSSSPYSYLGGALTLFAMVSCGKIINDNTNEKIDLENLNKRIR